MSVIKVENICLTKWLLIVGVGFLLVYVLALGWLFWHLFLEGMLCCPHTFTTNELFYVLGWSSCNLFPCNV